MQANPLQPDRTFTAAVWLLRIGILIHAAGLFAAVFATRQTHFGNYLFLGLFDNRPGIDDPYMTAVLVEKITVSVFMALALVAVVRPWAPLLLVIAAYVLAEAVCGTLQAGYRFSEWTVPASALRWGLPLVLLILVALPRLNCCRRWRLPLAAQLLALLVATVFFVHGYLAWRADPRFIDLILGSSVKLFDFRPTEARAVSWLKAIALVDFAVALAALLSPAAFLLAARRRRQPSPAGAPATPPGRGWRRAWAPTLFLWLAFWGLVTALSRMVSLGYPGGMSEYPEVLLRASHVVGPLALWALCNGIIAAGGVRGRETAQPPQAAADSSGEPVLPVNAGAPG